MLFAGCAKPPTQEVESAEKAIADAKKAEVDLCLLYTSPSPRD